MRWRCHCWDKEEITLESKTTPYPTTACKEEPHGIPTTSQPTLQFTNFFQKFTGTDLCFGEMHNHAHTGERRKKCTFLFFFPTKNSFWGRKKKDKKEKSTYRGCRSASKEWQCRLIGQNYIYFFTRIFQSRCSYWLQNGIQVCFLKTSNTQYIKTVICTGSSDPWKPSSMLKGSTTNLSHMRKSTVK